MRIDFKGRLVDEPRIAAGFVGCGSHAFRNIYPTFQFAPVDLVATCDRDSAKAEAFAKQFGAARAYDDMGAMLAGEKLDAVFIVVGYDDAGRPMQVKLAHDALAAGCHVWMEKPPAATTAELVALRDAARRAERHVVIGYKKMFMPATQKARQLTAAAGFDPHLLLMQYPLHAPTQAEFDRYAAGENVKSVVGFVDHVCHPASLMVELFGTPDALSFVRSDRGSGAATFTYKDGRVASLAMTGGQSINGGMERTVIVGAGRHVSIENNLRVTLHQLDAPLGYGDAPDFYVGGPAQTSAVWEPEFSLGQLYNKGLFSLGYYDEVNHFARAVLDGVAPARGTVDQAIGVTAVAEAFARAERTVKIQADRGD